MGQPLTKKQKQVVDFIEQFYKEQGFSPTMQEIADEFNVAISTIQDHLSELTAKGYISRKRNTSRSIVLKEMAAKNMTVSLQMLGTISAGQGIEVYEEASPTQVEVPADWVNKDNLRDHYCLKVEGFSMYKDGILDGDTVVVRKQPTASNGETVVAIIKEDDREIATLKKFYRQGNEVELRPMNPQLNSMIVQPEQLDIRGKFVGLIRNS